MAEEFHESDLMFKLLKIYIVQYLSTVHGFKSFQHEAINMLALYILKVIKKVALPTKRLISLQGVTIPNCLHLVEVIHESKFVDMLQLINFLYKQSTNTTKNMQAFKTGFESLGRDILEQPNQDVNQHKQQILYTNIKYIPHVYTYNPEDNALPIRVPVDQGIKKPADYTYKHSNEKIQKVDKSIEKLGNYTSRQMRKSLGILGTQEFEEFIEKPKKMLRIKQAKQVGMDQLKSKFSMINYI